MDKPTAGILIVEDHEVNIVVVCARMPSFLQRSFDSATDYGVVAYGSGSAKSVMRFGL
jgi:hypothetical protein